MKCGASPVAGPELVVWAAARDAWARRAPPLRVILLRDAATPDGLPRARLLHPGRRLPALYPTLPAALAALASMKAHR